MVIEGPEYLSMLYYVSSEQVTEVINLKLKFWFGGFL